jgi:DNA-binding NarL/FixJ family response regulator
VTERLWLPNLLRELRDVFGQERALKLARELGGQSLKLPVQPRPDHPIARAVGVDVLTWLIAQHARGERITIPQGPEQGVTNASEVVAAAVQAGISPRAIARQAMALRRAEVRKLIRQGFKPNEIAAATGMHERSVRTHRSELQQALTARQGRLFDED